MDNRGVAGALVNLGYVAVGQENVRAARSYLEESLSLAGEMGVRLTMIEDLSGLAWVFEKNGQAEIAAQLQGACSRWLGEMSAVMEPFERTVYDKTCVALKQALGEEGYLAAFEKGKTLSLEQAKALALSLPEQ